MIDRFEGEYFFLSNFSESPLNLYGADDGVLVAPTVEHAYQAAKTEDWFHFKRIIGAPTPNQAKRFGRRAPIRADWEVVKDRIMEDLLLYKFADPVRRRKLLDTGSEELVEGNWWGDTYWGVCKGEGKNMLGKLLMKVRDAYSTPEMMSIAEWEQATRRELALQIEAEQRASRHYE